MNKLIVKSLATAVSVVAMWWIATGCMGPTIYNTTDMTKVPIQYGNMSDNLRIVAENGSFELMQAQQFTSPFQVDLWSCPGITGNNLIGAYGTALTCGAQRVKVYVGTDPEPLYGVLALNYAIRAATGPASRSYVIQVRPDKIAAARVGNTSVSFEQMDYRNTWTVDGSPRSRTQSGYGWVLWLSKFPLQ